MAKHRSYSIEFERQVAQEYLGGETLHGLSRMGLCRMASTDIPRAKADVSWQTGRSLAASSRGIKLKRTRNSGYRPDST